MLATQRRTFSLGPYTLQLDTVADSEALLDALIARGASDPDYQDEVLPYWADLWHSALALGEYVATADQDWPNTRVIELGCGLGLPGIAAVLRGGKVTFTDYVTDALDFARHNLALNQANAQAAFLRLDWRDPPQDVQYDLVLAADVAYESRFFQPLYHTIHRLLVPGGECWLTEPGRKIAREFLEGFSAAGFAVLGEVFTTVALNGTEQRVRLVRLRKPVGDLPS
ncbi:methyltransferase domain-containing protein [Neolewinella lacunae]|nr:protein N-lysine methyltransferase family protein [Neolewinella lacunae]MDN3636080.1 methyltransferase domain-containing protein [Neolewinella lacunae]